MARGENLRLLLGGKCVAASTSTTVHLAAEIQEISTKDQVGGWVNNICTGLSWDGGVDALVVPEEAEMLNALCVTAQGSIFVDRGTLLKAGDMIEIVSSSNKCDIIHNGIPMGAQVTAPEDGTYYVGSTTKQTTAVVKVVDREALSAEDLVELLRAGVKVQTEFVVTEGAKNRVKSSVLCSGEAIVTDISVSAGNRALSTVSCKIVGTGELARE